VASTASRHVQAEREIDLLSILSFHGNRFREPLQCGGYFMEEVWKKSIEILW
jgi:hypothetical protein